MNGILYFRQDPNGIMNNGNDKELKNEVELLHVLYYKTKNQFKGTTWWKYFSMLHRMTRKYEQTRDEKIAEFITKTLSSDAYRAFNGIVAQGQFITLGFTLIGLLARVNKLLTPKKGEPEVEAQVGQVAKASIKQPIDNDLGQVLSRDSIKKKKRPIEKEVDEKTAEKPTKKKKKSKRTEIDDIFGF